MTEIMLAVILIILVAASNLLIEDTRTQRCAAAARDTIQVVAVRDSVLLECYRPRIDIAEAK